MQNHRLWIMVSILALLTLSCGLPAALTGGDDGDVTQVASDSSGSEADSEPAGAGADEGAGVAELDTLDSYRLNMTWRIESEDAGEEFTMNILQEWVKEPPASRFVMAGAEPGAEPVSLMEFIAIGDSAWMRAGDTWIESPADTAEGMAESWTGMFSGDDQGWDYVGPETVNGVQCRHYKSTDKTSVALAAPDEGGTVQLSVQGESWVADESGLPPVAIRERMQLEGGFLPFPIPGSAGAAGSESGTFYLEYDLTDINTAITITPPGEFSEMPAPPSGAQPPGPGPSAGQGAGGQGPGANAPGAEPALPPPPAETQVQARASDGMNMAYVAAGEFLMGDDKSPFAPERPGHIAYLDAFWMDQTEVTNAQYRLCVDAGACTPPASWDRPELAGDQQPVLAMWIQAQAYCQWVGGRLPSEAEWEKAARGTDGRLWPWGNQFEEGRANLSRDADGYEFTAPVGTFPSGASPYGLLDMAGNAGEWVADWYSPDYYGRASAQNPAGPAGGEQRVYRSNIANAGGGQEKCRTVARYSALPDSPKWIFGFRCASAAQP